MARKSSVAAKKLGETIRWLRSKRRGLNGRITSQEEFAEMAGFHRTYWSAIERGERNVSLENIVVIARTLGVKASDLLRRSGL
ncbi:MAG TPA: helix-turn-helix transcriptional regulator [Bdellovibrionota bacterium]|nr:helix-turn-helix transcriptional regulator [Bdellovibrionota bacterium]